MRAMLRVGCVCVVLAGAVSAQSLSGTLATSGDVVSASLINVPSVVIQITGTWTGGPVFEVSADDGANWLAAPVTPLTSTSAVGGSTTTQTGANGVFVLANPGYTTVRVRAASWSTGTATVAIARGFAGTVLPRPASVSSVMQSSPAPSLPVPACNAVLKTNCK